MSQLRTQVNAPYINLWRLDFRCKVSNQDWKGQQAWWAMIIGTQYNIFFTASIFRYTNSISRNFHYFMLQKEHAMAYEWKRRNKKSKPVPGSQLAVICDSFRAFSSWCTLCCKILVPCSPDRDDCAEPDSDLPWWPFDSWSMHSSFFCHQYN